VLSFVISWRRDDLIPDAQRDKEELRAQKTAE
jgi:hypothetical protein